MNEAVRRMEQAVAAAVCAYQMLPRGCTVVVGFSGGADSTALLHWLSAHAAAYGVQVVAAHLHHGLRGAEADRDAAFVQAWCAEHAVPLRMGRADVRAQARETGEGIEECGRRLRYAFFCKIGADYPKARFATAHTLSDNAETVLLRLARGAGTAGLSGIPPVRGAVVRPFIQVSRRQVEQYCSYYNLEYITDSTNSDLRYARNRVRRCVVPQMERIDPQFEQAAGRAARALREDEDCLRALGREALQRAACGLGWRAAGLLAAPRAVRVRALAQAAAQAGAGMLCQAHFDTLDRLLGRGGGCVLPGGVEARVEQGTLLFGSFPAGGWCVPLALPETALPDGRTLCIRVVPRAQAENLDLPFSNCIDYDTITTDTVARTRLAGDRFSLPGRGISKPLRKLQGELHLPASLRGGLALLADAGGLLWAEGCGPSQRAAVGPGTRRLAVVQIKRGGQ